MDKETRTFISGEFDKLAGSIARSFEAVGRRFDGVEHRLGNVELRLGSLEIKISDLSDTLEQEMIFTSGFRDEFAGRLKALEVKAG